MDRDVSFGGIVKENRQSLDLTQAELARRVACATITIRKIEYDSLRPSIQIAERLATSLKIPSKNAPPSYAWPALPPSRPPPPSPCPPRPLHLRRSVSKISPGAPSAASNWVTA